MAIGVFSESAFKFTVKVGGVNAAFPISATSQDYFITPGQEWIYGVRVQEAEVRVLEHGVHVLEERVRQFQVLESGSRYIFRSSIGDDMG